VAALQLCYSVTVQCGRGMMAVIGTSVWTGRALQVGYDGLEIVGLAHLYSAL